MKSHDMPRKNNMVGPGLSPGYGPANFMGPALSPHQPAYWAGLGWAFLGRARWASGPEPWPSTSLGPSTNICTVWAIGIISKKILAAVEFEFYENNEKWSNVDEWIIGGIPISSERDREG